MAPGEIATFARSEGDSAGRWPPHAAHLNSPLRTRTRVIELPQITDISHPPALAAGGGARSRPISGPRSTGISCAKGLYGADRDLTTLSDEDCVPRPTA